MDWTSRAAQFERGWPLVIAAPVVLTGAVIALPVPGLLRVVVVVAFLLTIPGLVVVHAMRIRDGLAALMLIVPTSLALEMLVATCMLYVGAWSPAIMFVLLAGACLVIAALDASMARRPLRIRAGKGWAGTFRARTLAPHGATRPADHPPAEEEPAEQEAAAQPAAGPPRARPARRRRRKAGETAPDHLLHAPGSVHPAADDFFDGLVRRIEGDR